MPKRNIRFGDRQSEGARPDHVGFFRRLQLDAGVADHVIAHSLRVGAERLDDIGGTAGALDVALDAIAHTDAVAGRRPHPLCRDGRDLPLPRRPPADAAGLPRRSGADLDRGPGGQSPRGAAASAGLGGPRARCPVPARAVAGCGGSARGGGGCGRGLRGREPRPAGSNTNPRWWLRWALCLSSDRLAAVGRLDDAIAACGNAAEVARVTWEEAVASLVSLASTGLAASAQDQSSANVDEREAWLSRARTLLAAL